MKDEKKLDNLFLRYDVTSEPYYEKSNIDNFKAIQDALNEVGVYISLDENSLYISINKQAYLRQKNRNAGRRKKVTAVSKDDYKCWRYSDIVLMMQTMTDKQICETLGMAPATYYRHKRELKSSNYYESLDKNRLDDREYLESVKSNFMF